MTDREYIYYKSIGSTNTVLQDRIRKSPAPVFEVICASMQTGGRGRNGKSFCSPPGGLYFSAAYPFEQTPEKLSFLTLLAGLCVCKTLETRFGPRFTVKWPNDIYAGDKKLCGILTEWVSDTPCPAAVVGVGLNVLTDESGFAPEIRETAVSLALLGLPAPEPAVLMKDTVALLDAFVYGKNALNGDTSAFAAQINERSYLNGRRVEVKLCDTVYSGTAAGISPDGALLLRADDSMVKITAGEIILN